MSPIRNNRGQRARFRPAIEGLEDRTVPAGNVTAVVNGGNLIISGDANDNLITVRGNTRGTIDVESIGAGTTINNQPGTVTFVGFNGSVLINMGEGGDAIVMERVTVNGRLDIDMGNGLDSLALVRSNFKNDVNVAMGAGDDVLMFGSTTVGNNAYVNSGPGDNQVHLLGATFERSSFFVAGAGTSSVGTVGGKFGKAPSMVGFQQKVNVTLPNAFNDAATVASGGTVSVNVIGNDRANQGTLVASTVVITRQPTHGTVSINADGTVAYKNNGSGSSSDSFSYSVRNSVGAISNNATVNISVTNIAGPSVTVASAAGAATNDTPIPFTANFSDDVTGFVQADITVTNGTISNFVATNGRAYTFDVTPSGQGAVVVTVPASVAQNAAGLNNTASAATTVTFDTASPTITINPLTTNSTTPTITGTVSEANSTVTVTVNNQTINATVTGTTWSATLTSALTAGTFSVTATGTDPAGNTATVNSGSALVIDLTPPTAVITSNLTSPTGSTSIPITVTFSENVTGFIGSDITVTNGTLSNFQAVDLKTYTAVITPTASGAVTANIAAGAATDTAGNASVAAPGFTITFDSTIPGVNITSSATNPTSSTSIPITFTFTESVTGFEAGDITVTNGTLSNFTAVNGTTYTATVTPTADGAVTVNVPAGVANDVDNKGNSSASFSITFDTSAPTPAIASTVTSPTNSSTIPITVTFNENVTGFIAGDISVTNGTLGAFTALDGRTYTATITPSANGVVTVNIAAGAATDVAGIASVAATPFSITFDNVSPTVAITSSVSSPTGTTPIPITVTFSENVTGFAAADIVVTNGTLGNFTQVSGSTYTATITPTANGAVSASIAAGAATDTAGNNSAAAPQFSITFNNSLPGVAITSTVTSPTKQTSIPITITFTENITGFVEGDITVSNGTLSGFTTVDAKTFTATLTPTAAGAVTANIAAGVAFDVDNNGNSATSFSITFDATSPTVAITSSATSPTNSTSIPITVTFSENVTGFDAGDISVTNGTLNNFVATNGTTYTATITPASNGVVRVNIAAGAASDAASNASLVAPEFTITSDTTGPTVAIASSLTSPTGSTSIPITVTFNETVTGFAAADIVVANGTLGNFTQVSGTTYTASITPTANGAVTANIAAGAATDTAGNASTAAPGFSITFNNSIPGLAITSNVTSPTKQTTIPITIEFTENVTGFEASDMTVSNGALSNFTAVDGNTYTATLTPTANGDVTVNIAADVAVDIDNNGNSAASFSIAFDTTSPTAAITSSATSPTNLTSIPITVTFSENVTGFAAGDITVSNGTLSNFTAVSGTTYTAILTPASNGAIKVNIAAGAAADTAGNASLVVPEFSITADTTVPTVAITTNVTSPTGSTPIPITVTFSENVTGFTAADIIVGNGTLGNFVQANGSTYTATITPTASGAVTANIAAGAASDAAGNANTAAQQLSITFNSSTPGTAITSTATNPTNDTSIPITITFTENVNGFVAGDITVSNGTLGSFTTVDAKTYTAVITPTAAGAVTANIAAGVANDVDNNGNSAASFSITFDATSPTVAITSSATSPTNATSIPITVTFSENVTGFTADDVVVTNGTLGNFTAVDGKIYTATITPTANGVVRVNIAAAAATDLAGNDSVVAPEFAITFDNASSNVAITSTLSSPTGSTAIPITVTFDKNVTGLTAADIVVANGTLSNFTQVSGSSYSATISPTASGAVTANIAAGAATDAAGNPSAAAQQFSITFDNTLLGAAITSNVTNPTKLTSIPITIAFTENVTGFEATDITVSNGTLGGFTTVDAKTFTATLTPTADGAVTATIAAGAAVDADSNGNSPASFSITFDSTSPTVAVTSSATSPTSTNPIPITITFSEIVSGFVATDVAITNGTLNSLATVDGKVYTGTITASASGAVTVNIASAAAIDAAGNESVAAPAFSITFADNVAPTVAVTSTLTSPTGSTSIPITVTFSETVTGFAASDITVGNGTLSNFTAVSGTTYTATITPTANGAVTVNVAAGAANDVDSNPNSAAPPFSITFNNSAPTVARTLSNVTNSAAANNTTLLLPGTFADADITNSSVTFKATKGTTPVDLNVELFDKDAPLTVANFFNYLDRYAANGGTIFHRLHLETGLEVLQGGGYAFNDATDTITNHIATDAAIINEYSSQRPNVRGTISMAKLGGDPNSATSEFFFNLDDANGNTLGSNNNGGFTVFGKLAAAADLTNIDRLAAVPIKGSGAFPELPLVDGTTIDENNIERITQIVVNNRDNELTYSVTSSNSAAVTATVAGFQGNQLTLDYLAAGTSTITVTATDKAGQSASTTFVVTVT